MTIKQEQLEKLSVIIEKYRGQEGGLIPVLQETQEIFNYLPKEALSIIGRELKIPLSQIYGVVTFHSQFYLSPHGKYTIRACRGTACHVRGAKKIISQIRNIIGICENQTTSDLKFTFETATCLGVCALAPVIMINKGYFGKMTPQKVATILHQYNRKGEIWPNYNQEKN